MKLKKTAVVAALAMVISSLAGCAGSMSASTAPTTTGAATGSPEQLAQPINLGVGAQVGSYLLPYFAEEQGLFEAEGLTDVTVSIVPGPQLPSALAGGTVDVGVLGAPAVDLGALNGPVKIIGTWQSSPEAQLVAGPGISSIEDLKGKSVAINGGKAGLATFVLIHALLNAGMTESDVKFVVLSDYPSQLQAFTSGQADATVAGPPFVDSILKDRAGSSVIRSFDDVVFPSPELVVNTNWAESNRAQAQALVRALESARAMWLAEPDLAKATLATQYNAPADSPAVASTYEATAAYFLPELAPVTLEMERSIFELARKVGFPAATDEAAATVIDPSYVTDALK